jgi:hypothetical protein
MLSFSERLIMIVELLSRSHPPVVVNFLITAISKFPLRAPSKQVDWVVWITRLAEMVGEQDFPLVVKPLFMFYARLARSLSSKVVEASFKIWTNIALIPRIIDYTREVFLLLHPSIMQTMRDHWKRSTQLHCLSTLAQMQDLDPYIFQELNLAPKKKQQPLPVDETLGVKANNWKLIARAAAKRDRDLSLKQAIRGIDQIFEVPLT